MFEELTDDGARYACAITTFIKGCPQWDCPRDATRALTWAAYNEAQERLPKSIKLRHRSLCPTHQEMMVRDYLG